MAKPRCGETREAYPHLACAREAGHDVEHRSEPFRREDGTWCHFAWKEEPTLRRTCGTPAGASAHTAHAEERCTACNDAANLAQRCRKIKKGTGTGIGYGPRVPWRLVLELLDHAPWELRGEAAEAIGPDEVATAREAAERARADLWADLRRRR